jgi:predicted GH43/DUF377 family glycosyl hydrolase
MQSNKLGTMLIIAAMITLHCAVAQGARPPSSPFMILHIRNYLPMIREFNQNDPETIPTNIPNSDASEWLKQNVPLLDCPDKSLEQIYMFRWWTYRKHIRLTPNGYIITEFLPDVPWAGKDNSISCAAGHHIYEGRWIRNDQYLNDYSMFWFRNGGGNPRQYSFWAANAMYARYLVNGDKSFLINLLPDLIRNYEGWEQTNYSPKIGLFHQVDDRDGMEVSIGGSGYRPTINSYMYGDAVAISKIASLAGQKEIAREYMEKAEQLKSNVERILWNPADRFFETSPDGEHIVGVREEIGFVPWYFDLPEPDYDVAWKQLMDPEGFYAPYGPTTAERRSPRFMFSYPHDCLWNGPSWPYATSQTLTALANLLNDYPKQSFIDKRDYYTLLRNYAKSQYKDGKPWIAEDLNGITGKWIVDLPRSVWYNHSTYCDLIISGLIGLRPRADDIVEVNPLLPPNTWDYFCLDGVPYHHHSLTILYDKTGEHYRRGKGLMLFVDGKRIASAAGLQRVTGRLPKSIAATSKEKSGGGWVKYMGNPVLGGDLGTCFDISVLKHKGVFRMWFSWRPKQCIALTESKDGIHWSAPQIVLGPNPASGWEADINRPCVIKGPSGKYQMWYTGQSNGKSWIGYAVSSDGVHWERQSGKPVLSAGEPWEKVAVMCPDVIWDAKAHLYRMWYSGGDQYEPDAIGYATSKDGLHWVKSPQNPIFTPDASIDWEKDRVTACQVIPWDGWYYMFYIGFRDVDHAQIGLARSKDGVHDWRRYSANPIVSPTPDGWDSDACYKPFAVRDGNRWLLWYNGRHEGIEQIGLVIHDGLDIWGK